MTQGLRNKEETAIFVWLVIAMEAILKVKGMHCKSCEAILKEDIAELEGVSNVSADAQTGIVKFAAAKQEAVDMAKEIIRKDGYSVY